MANNVLVTAWFHFEDDIRRARALVDSSENIPFKSVQEDIWRAAIMMAVGASDAFFSDAYVDLISRALRAIDIQDGLNVPEGILKLKFPIAILAQRGVSGWGYRLASRNLMEKENVLSLDNIKKRFNVFYPDNSQSGKALSSPRVLSWINRDRAKKRHFGILASDYNILVGPDKSAATKSANETFNELFKKHYQRRHDCIHNCDRVKVKPQRISKGMASKCIDDFEFLVGETHEDFVNEFGLFLRRIGCNAATRNQVT